MPDQERLAGIALGSNLSSRFGDRADNLRMAATMLGNLGQVTAMSSFYDTAPEIYVEQPRFLNAALLLRTAMEPVPLMRTLLAIEAAMGRERAGVPAKGPRVIDLDLLFMDDLIVDSPVLRLPHPAMPDRRFVLEPLAEIAPGWVHPELGITVRALMGRLERGFGAQG